ncbi:MAG: TonB-dependent receptor plug domain-containing protein [Caulobacteraceae bacterium]
MSTLAIAAAISLIGANASAQTEGASANAAGSAATVGEIVVTGSRIVRAGFAAPTPVTVVSTEQLQRTAPGEIAQGLNQLPQFAATRSNATPGGLGNTPATGNYLNLRNLGSQRNLVLLDGHRLPPTSYEGITDTNIIPQALVQRVDVVTGGASAAYGSDAVSGVINFILDTHFHGVKAQFQGGQTEYGDAPTVKGNIAFGGNVLNDRVHLMFSYDHFQQQGIIGNSSRPYGSANWLRTGTGTVANPYKEFQNVRFSNASYGTQISTVNTGNPLAGYQFVPGGLAVPMNLGTATGSAGASIGGDGPVVLGRSLTAAERTDTYFGRADFEVAPGVQAFGQLSYADNFASSISVGSGTQIGDFRIFTDNAFIADSTRAILQNAGVTSFIGSRVQADQPPKRQNTEQKAVIFLSGLKGMLANKYNWDIGYSHGDTRLNVGHEGNFNNQRYYAGLDAVKNAQGQIVCRITITNPGVLDDCVPFNIFGNGSPSQTAYSYISQTSRWGVHQTMDIGNVNLSGEVFSLPAGAVQAAVGAEYRTESMVVTSNSDPSKSIDLTGIRTNTSPFILKFNSTNVGATNASRNVKEAYVEVDVPILKDVAFAKALSLNAAGRYTDYSSSGGVNTWKFGASWTAVDSVRFRVTRSRDIRAPSLNDLYAAPNSGSVAFLDIHTNTNARLTTTSTGNPNLKPEIGNTFTGGVVFSPTFVRPLQMSVDYYDINIDGAIATPTTNDLMNECEASNGTAAACAFFVRPLPFSNRTAANFPSLQTSYPINQAALKVSGLDYELSYRFNFDAGLLSKTSNLDLRLIGGHLFQYKTTTAQGAVPQATDNSANNSADRVNVQLNWETGPLSVASQVRWIGPRKKTQDPTLHYADGFSNDIPSITYVDATATYRFKHWGGQFESYVTISNLFNQQPPLIPGGGQPGQPYPTNAVVYDIYGRTYNIGLRARF